MSIFRQIYQLLRDLEVSDKKLVVMKGAGQKAFCAGLDLNEFMKDPLRDSQLIHDTSIAMDYISTYKKPYVAVIDGIIMGGGCFYSMTGKFRIATERTIFAMPETEIGFFPNAGSSYFLPRLKYNLGFYVGLAGARIYGYDVKKFGLASHFIESKRINDFMKTVVTCTNEYEVGKTIANYSTVPLVIESELDEVISKIDKCFDSDSVEEVYANLHLDGSEWAVQTIRNLNRMSPTSMKISHRLLTMGKSLTLRECLKLEHSLSHNIVMHGFDEFKEGVRALIVDKDLKPKWNPKTLSEVKEEQLEKIFAPLTGEHELTFESDAEKAK